MPWIDRSVRLPTEDPRLWPKDGEIFDLHRLAIAVRPGPHPFHLAYEDAARANWRIECAANPALYDGQLLLLATVRLCAGEILADAHVLPYSTFLYWRKQAAPPSGFHLFGFPVLLSSDGALIAIEMAAHTANPGQVYCPAGSLDPSDIVNGYADVEANMRREVREETGLDLSRAVVDPQLRAYRLGRRITVFQVFRLPMTQEAVFERIADHMRCDPEQEIARPVAVWSADPSVHRFFPAMMPLLDWLFAGRTSAGP